MIDRSGLPSRRTCATGSATRVAALLLALVLAGAGSVRAHDQNIGDLTLDHPYATPSLAGSPNGAAYLKGIRNRGNQPDRLIGASSPVAARVELHRMTLVDGVMRMRAVPGLDLPAGKAVALKPGGYHVMLMDLKQPLKNGESVPLTLVVEGKDGKRETLELKVPVKAAGAAMPMADHKH